MGAAGWPSPRSPSWSQSPASWRGLNFGVEFTGGRLMEYSTSTPVDSQQARAAIAGLGFPRAVVQSSGNDDLTVRA
jgi:SecD/SecF fusion protein